jgi:hypothetical protein
VEPAENGQSKLIAMLASYDRPREAAVNQLEEVSDTLRLIEDVDERVRVVVFEVLQVSPD